MALGRRRQVGGYLSAGLKKAKNIHTRRTQTSNVIRDVTKAARAKKNKRVK